MDFLTYYVNLWAFWSSKMVLLTWISQKFRLRQPTVDNFRISVHLVLLSQLLWIIWSNCFAVPWSTLVYFVFSFIISRICLLIGDLILLNVTAGGKGLTLLFIFLSEVLTTNEMIFLKDQLRNREPRGHPAPTARPLAATRRPPPRFGNEWVARLILLYAMRF